jgi:hypothetical protein
MNSHYVIECPNCVGRVSGEDGLWLTSLTYRLNLGEGCVNFESKRE